MSLEEPGRLEEERRLAYVGITRAMRRLVISYAETRRLYGTETRNKVSRFVREIPEGLIQEVRLNNSVSRPFAAPRNQSMSDSHLFAGSQVPETDFGAQARVQVNFANEGTKWLMLGYAKLEAV
jgi:DNA helicase-2/ATP-dependent DNA helicase PcrA